jgi:hypothetical protein
MWAFCGFEPSTAGGQTLAYSKAGPDVLSGEASDWF